jgi:hypothetical protein
MDETGKNKLELSFTMTTNWSTMVDPTNTFWEGCSVDSTCLVETSKDDTLWL